MTVLRTAGSAGAEGSRERPPLQLIVGPPKHGAVEYGRDVATAVSALVGAPTAAAARDLAEAELVARQQPRVHLHVADKVFGRSAEDSAEAIEHLAQFTSVTVTLHDLPQASDGPVNFGRRADAYRRIAVAARGVAVSSAHEAGLFGAVVGAGAPSAAVIPLGTRIRRVGNRAIANAPGRSDVGIAGYFYPGKGHDAVISAMAMLESSGRRAPTRLLGLGTVSPGHEGEYADLVAAAAIKGIWFGMTGYLARDEYERQLATVGVPIAAHAHMSASRSILDWIEAGRRPLVTDTAYTRELDQLRPGVIRLFDEESLVASLDTAVSDPASTTLEPGSDLGFSVADAAETYLHWWAHEVRW